jgi:hypothetical protein
MASRAISMGSGSSGSSVIVRDSASIAEPLRLTPSRKIEFFDGVGGGLQRYR